MDINEDSLKDTTSKGLTFHKMIEAIKFAYGKRFELGDADFVPGVREVMHLPCEQNSTFCYLFANPFPLIENRDIHWNVISLWTSL